MRRQPCNGGGVHAASSAQLNLHATRVSRCARLKLGPPCLGLDFAESNILIWGAGFDEITHATLAIPSSAEGPVPRAHLTDIGQIWRAVASLRFSTPTKQPVYWF